jgi:hypothetical protein
MLSAINRLPRKAFCIGLIIVARAWDSLTVRILAITLYITLQQEIGRKSEADIALANLGIRAMMVL